MGRQGLKVCWLHGRVWFKRRPHVCIPCPGQPDCGRRRARRAGELGRTLGRCRGLSHRPVAPREVGTWPVAPRVGGQAGLGPLLSNNLPINLGWARPVAPHNRTLGLRFPQDTRLILLNWDRISLLLVDGAVAVPVPRSCECVLMLFYFVDVCCFCAWAKTATWINTNINTILILMLATRHQPRKATHQEPGRHGGQSRHAECVVVLAQY